MFAVTGVLLLSIGAIAAQPLASETNSVIADNAKETSIWKDTPMDTVVQEFRAECLQQSDSAACIKVKVLNLLDDVLRKDSLKVSPASNYPSVCKFHSINVLKSYPRSPMVSP